ncbi:MAG: hypothetical protein ABFD69_02520 [Candidatus Sumerlaeia bacterium]
MTRFIACLLLLVVAPAAMAQNLAGHKVVVRRYSRLAANPAAYEGVVVDIKPDGIGLEPGQIPDAGALVLTAPDQKDPDVAALLQGGVFSAAYRDGQVDTGSGFAPLAQRRPTLADFGVDGETTIVRKTVLDAFGKPIIGAAVEIGLEHGKDGGGPVMPGTPSDIAGGIEFFSTRGFYRSVRIAISHERYGAALFANADDAKLPLVADDDPAAPRALSGIIFDSAGKPAAGALIKLSHLRAPGMGLINAAYGCAALSGRDGRFRIYPLVKGKRAEDADLVPPGSTYHISVELPSDPGQPPLAFQPRSGADAEIRLTSGDRVRRFSFVDANGAAFDPARIQNVIIRGPSQSQRYAFSDAARGMRFLPGTYEASLTPAPKFEPVTIDSKSPETIVFRVAGSIAYEGRVIDAITSRPLAGALVYIMTMQVSENWHDLTAQQWEAIHRLPAEPGIDAAALAPMRAGGRPVVARTGPDGRYRITAPAGMAVHSLGAVEENYLNVQQPVHAARPDEKGVVAVADFGLVPAAVVTVSVIGPDGARVTVIARWVADAASLPPRWKESLFSDRIGSRVIYPYMHGGASGSIPVPAGIPLGLTLRPPTRSHLAPVRIAGPIQLNPGQTRDLGEVKAVAMALGTVQVLGPDAMPIEGLPVRAVTVENGKRMGGLACNTDAQGLAFLDVEPGSRGLFVAARGIEIPYDCPPGAPELPVQKITLTAEQFATVKQILENAPGKSQRGIGR